MVNQMKDLEKFLRPRLHGDAVDVDLDGATARLDEGLVGVFAAANGDQIFLHGLRSDDLGT